MRVRVRVVQLHLLLVAIEEVEPKVRGRRHEGRLVRGGRGEAPLVAHGLGDHGVAQREVEEEVAALALLVLAALAVERGMQLGTLEVDHLVRVRVRVRVRARVRVRVRVRARVRVGLGLGLASKLTTLFALCAPSLAPPSGSGRPRRLRRARPISVVPLP